MTAQPIPLATQLADLRAAAEAHTGRCWLTRALEAMIMAALARIFGRLEELVRLWQAGLLQGLPSHIMAPHGTRPNPTARAGEAAPTAGCGEPSAAPVSGSRRSSAAGKPIADRQPTTPAHAAPSRAHASRPQPRRASRIPTPHPVARVPRAGGNLAHPIFRREISQKRPSAMAQTRALIVSISK